MKKSLIPSQHAYYPPQRPASPNHLLPAKENKYNYPAEMLSPKPRKSWKKHEPIHQLLGEQRRDRQSQCSNQETALKDMERKYQELQEKYRLLMKEAVENAKEFQRDKRELATLKSQREEDQHVLSTLKQELISLHEGMQQTQNNQLQTPKSRTSINIASSMSLPPPRSPSKPTEKSNMRVSRNRTSQNWTHNLHKKGSTVQDNSKAGQSRYASAEKIIDSMRRSKHKNRYESGNVESKTSIRMEDSMRGSRAALPKQLTDVSMGLEQGFAKSSTPNLKKMMTAKPYSKYRFQPSCKLD